MNIKTTTKRVNTSETLNSCSIINYIINNEFTDFTTMINNKEKVNLIIDNERGYTALHYAIQFHRYKMIEYLLKLGAIPTIKTKNDGDAYDLSLKYQCKEAIKYILNENDNNKKVIFELRNKIDIADQNIRYMTDSIDKLNMNQSTLKKENGELKRESNDLKNKYNESVKESNNLSSTIERLDTTIFNLREEVNTLKNEKDSISNQFSGLKRKYDNLQKSFDTISSKMRK